VRHRPRTAWRVSTTGRDGEVRATHRGHVTGLRPDELELTHSRIFGPRAAMAQGAESDATAKAPFQRRHTKIPHAAWRFAHTYGSVRPLMPSSRMSGDAASRGHRHSSIGNHSLASGRVNERIVGITGQSLPDLLGWRGESTKTTHDHSGQQ